jgi:hypothetical protein
MLNWPFSFLGTEQFFPATAVNIVREKQKQRAENNGGGGRGMGRVFCDHGCCSFVNLVAVGHS